MTKIKQHSQHSHRNFRLRLVIALIGDYTTKKDNHNKIYYLKNKGGVFEIPDENKLLNLGIHLPEEINNYKRCKHCSTTDKEQRTKIQCSYCNIALCAKNSFKLFHTAPLQ